MSRVWHDQPFIGPRTVDVHVAWLRQKLEENPQMRRHIVTVRGDGYCFACDLVVKHGFIAVTAAIGKTQQSGGCGQSGFWR